MTPDSNCTSPLSSIDAPSSTAHRSQQLTSGFDCGPLPPSFRSGIPTLPAFARSGTSIRAPVVSKADLAPASKTLALRSPIGADSMPLSRSSSRLPSLSLSRSPSLLPSPPAFPSAATDTAPRIAAPAPSGSSIDTFAATSSSSNVTTPASIPPRRVSVAQPEATTPAMAAPTFQNSPLHSPTAHFGSMDASVRLSDPDPRPLRSPLGMLSVGTSRGLASPDRACVVIHNLPGDTTEQSMRFMFAWTRQLLDVLILHPEPSGNSTLCTALLTFSSTALACEVKKMYDGMLNPNRDGQMAVEILPPSPQSQPFDLTSAADGLMVDGGRSNTSATPSGAHLADRNAISGLSPSVTSPASRVSSHFAAAFQQPLSKLTPPTANDRFVVGDVSNLFSPQSPIGNHLNKRSRITGKALIKNESVDDDDSGELLLKQSLQFSVDDVPLAASTLQRRATAPQLPISRLASLSLHTGLGVSSSLPPNSRPHHVHHPPYPKQHQHQPYGGPASAHPSNTAAMSPTRLSSAGAIGSSAAVSTFAMSTTPHCSRSHFPAANPADQNPPCNTLYVGNLPIDTSEEELKAMFSKQRGYKRLCFRTKSNGPMCFVEFEDVSFATKALNELYGQMLHNSVKGGIRLSFSKNPLGVRAGQPFGQLSPGAMHGIHGVVPGGGPNGFSTANGPPPGLSTPPGLSGRAFGFNHGQPGILNNISHAHMPSIHNQQQHFPVPYSPTPPERSWHGFSANSDAGFSSDGLSSYPSSYTPGR